MIDWKPIETAPKDGTIILAWPPIFTGSISCIYWNEDKYAKKPLPFWARVDNQGRRHQIAPTHWAPVPAGPAKV